MNFFAFSSLLIFVSSLTMAVILLLSSHRPKENVIWSIFCLFVSIWGIGSCMGTLSLPEKKIYFWWQVSQVGAIFSPILFYHFILEYLKLKKGPLVFITYSAGLFFLFINLFHENLFLGKLSFDFNQFYYPDWIRNKNIIYLVFYIYSYWVIVAIAFSLLLREFSKSKDKRRNQMKYFIVGISIGWIGAESDFLMDFGIKIYPLLNFFIALYPLILGYAMIRHQLMDINIIIKRSLIYSILITIITLFYFLIIFLIEHIFQTMFGYKSLIASLILATIIALLFTPLKDSIQKILEKTLFRGSYIQIVEENEQLLKEVAQSDRLRSIAVLASGMAHEIKNPLTPIKTFSEQLPIRIDDKEFLLKFSKIINKEVDRIDGLVQDLLNFAKPSPPQLQEANIHQLIQQTLELLNNQIISQKIKTEVTLSDKDSYIKVDLKQIKQAFLNLLINAIQAMPNGGTLAVSSHVIPTNTKIQNRYIIEISDTGSGIAPKDLPHIFDPFFSKKDNGTGLGLSITHEIIRSHNGKITVKSELGKGTTFRIELPL